MAKQELGELYYKITADTKGLDKGLNTSDKKVGGLGKSFTGLGSLIKGGFAVAAVAGIAKVSKELIAAASDAQETRNKFDVVFQDISEQAQDAADNLSENFGLSGQAAQSLLADTGDLLTGFGFTQESALDLSDQVNQLAVDLASFTNFSGGAEGASAALTKALLGERESVKSLGISILETDVKAKVLQITQEGMTFETERQAKAYATLLLAQEQSKNAIGDFSRSIDSYANQSRLAEAATADLKVAIGENLLDAATSTRVALASLTRGLADYIGNANKAKEIRRDLLDGTLEESQSLDDLQKSYALLSAKIALANGRMTKAQEQEKAALEALIVSYGITDSFLDNIQGKKEAISRENENANARAAKEIEDLTALELKAALTLEELKESALTDDEKQLATLREQINYWAQYKDTIDGASDVFEAYAAQRDELRAKIAEGNIVEEEAIALTYEQNLALREQAAIEEAM